MSEAFEVVFEDMLLTEGDYRIILQVGEGDVTRDGFLLQAESARIAFDLEFRGDSSRRAVELCFHLDQHYLRVKLLADVGITPLVIFGGIRKESPKVVYHSQFFDHHFSLKDHIRQIDTILRFSEGHDDLSSLFRSLRYEMAMNFNTLSNRLEEHSNQQ